jgi:hypothetical protein
MRISAASEWQRNNLPPLLVYLRINPNGNDVIAARQLGNEGSIISDVPEIVLWTLSGSNLNRDAQFAQIGEHLLIAIDQSGTAEEMLVASIYEGATICFPLNIPFQPPNIEITPSDNTVDTWFGFRFGYELYDGTIMRLGSVRLRRFNYSAPRIINFFTDKIVPSGQESYRKIIRGIAVFMTPPMISQFAVLSDALWYRIGMISWKSSAGTILDTHPDIANGGSGYTVNDVLTVVAGTGTGATIRVTSVSSGAITGAIFLTRGADYSTGSATLTGGTGSDATLTIGSVGAGADNFEFTLKDTPQTPISALIASYPQLDEDILTVHSIYATVLGSYNRAALLGRAEYEFVRPVVQLQPASTPVGKTKPGRVGIVFSPPSLAQEVSRVTRTCTITWIKPSTATGVSVEMTFYARYEFRLPTGEWVLSGVPVSLIWVRIGTNIAASTLVYSLNQGLDIPSQADPQFVRYVGHTLTFRIRAEYNDGVPSDWVYYDPDKGGIFA